ncbi:hypothetical protein N9N14_02950 [Candidatus Poseidonia alphae]|nr:hypothetical protein [Candidatus Poseidonia alphae]
MRPRHFGAASWDEEEDEEDEELDLSGFLSSAPPPPPVVERKRGASGMGNAGPRTQAAPEQEPAQMFGRPSNIGYVPAAVTAGNPWNPLYADDNAMFSPKPWVVTKTVGVVAATAGLGMGLSLRGARPVAFPVAALGAAAYVHTALGTRHGAWANFAADRHVISKVLGGAGVHLTGAYLFRAMYRKSRGDTLKKSFSIRGD